MCDAEENAEKMQRRLASWKEPPRKEKEAAFHDRARCAEHNATMTRCDATYHFIISS